VAPERNRANAVSLISWTQRYHYVSVRLKIVALVSTLLILLRMLCMGSVGTEVTPRLLIARTITWHWTRDTTDMEISNTISITEKLRFFCNDNLESHALRQKERENLNIWISAKHSDILQVDI
jgi:hypothetical protein